MFVASPSTVFVFTQFGIYNYWWFASVCIYYGVLNYCCNDALLWSPRDQSHFKDEIVYGLAFQFNWCCVLKISKLWMALPLALYALFSFNLERCDFEPPHESCVKNSKGEIEYCKWNDSLTKCVGPLFVLYRALQMLPTLLF